MAYEQQVEPLSVRMRWAAAVLDEASRYCGLPVNAAWTAGQLRRESKVVAEEGK